MGDRIGLGVDLLDSPPRSCQHHDAKLSHRLVFALFALQIARMARFSAHEAKKVVNCIPR